MNSRKYCIFSRDLRRVWGSRSYGTGRSSSGTLPNPPPLHALITEQDNAKASEWLKEFSSAEKKIPKELVELSFSRSSGPGGQVRWGDPHNISTQSELSILRFVERE